jgi:hypothetical protein
MREKLLPGLHTSSSLVQLRPHASSLYRLGVMVEAKDEQALRQLGQVLASCQRLKSLTINVYGRMGFTTEPFARLTAIRWLSEWTETLPRLTRLELSNVCVCLEDTWREWFKLIQWPYLRDTHFCCASFVLNGASALGHVHSLSLRLDSDNQAWGTYCPVPHSVDAVRLALHSFDSLANLRLRNATKVIDVAMLAHLGKTLKRLDTREDCDGNPFAQTGTVNYLPRELLHQIRLSCPHLRELALDAPNSGQTVCLSHTPPCLIYTSANDYSTPATKPTRCDEAKSCLHPASSSPLSPCDSFKRFRIYG